MKQSVLKQINDIDELMGIIEFSNRMIKIYNMVQNQTPAIMGEATRYKTIKDRANKRIKELMGIKQTSAAQHFKHKHYNLTDFMNNNKL